MWRSTSWESALNTSPSPCSAASIATSLLPTPVGPRITTSLVFIGGVRRQARGMRPPRELSLVSYLQPNAFSGPAKHRFELAFGKLDQHRPAVRALGGEIDFVEIAEQRADLVALELAVRANHAVAGDRRKTVFEAFLSLRASPPLRA